MNQYKVIGVSKHHNFIIGSVVTMVEASAGNDDYAIFECGDSGLTQFVQMADVEPIEISRQEAMAKLAAVVAEIYLKITEAENLADEHGLSFSLDIANGMVGDYYSRGADNPFEFEMGWNA